MAAPVRDPAADVQGACSLGAALSVAAELLGRRHPLALWATVTGETLVPWSDPASKCPGDWLDWRPVVPLQDIADAMGAELEFVDPGTVAPLADDDRYSAMRPFLMHEVDDGSLILVYGRWSTGPRPVWGLVKRALWNAGRFFGRAPSFLRLVEASLNGPPLAALIVRDVHAVARGKESEAADDVREHILGMIGGGLGTAFGPPGIPPSPARMEKAHRAISTRLRTAASRRSLFCAACGDGGAADAAGILLDWALRRRTLLGILEETPGLLPAHVTRRAEDALEPEVQETTAYIEGSALDEGLDLRSAAKRWASCAAADRAFWESALVRRRRKSGS